MQEYQDQTRTCIEKECGSTFTIPAKEVQFFVEKGLELPKRCKPCRARRKREKGRQ